MTGCATGAAIVPAVGPGQRNIVAVCDKEAHDAVETALDLAPAKAVKQPHPGEKGRNKSP